MCLCLPLNHSLGRKKVVFYKVTHCETRTLPQLYMVEYETAIKHIIVYIAFYNHYSYIQISCLHYCAVWKESYWTLNGPLRRIASLHGATKKLITE